MWCSSRNINIALRNGLYRYCIPLGGERTLRPLYELHVIIPKGDLDAVRVQRASYIEIPVTTFKILDYGTVEEVQVPLK